MAGWRDLVAQNTQDIRGNKANNPGIAAFKQIMGSAINLGMTKKAEDRQEAAGARNAARSIGFNKASEYRNDSAL